MPDSSAPGATAPSSSSPEMEYHGARLRAWYSDPIAEHMAARSAAGLFDRSFRVMFSAKGSDRTRFLHSMTTNDVKGLAPGRGLYATLLDVRGHILADLEIYCEEDQFLISTDADLIEKVLSTLGKYNIGGRVPLDRLPLAALSVEGPKSGELLRGDLQGPLPGPGEFSATTFLGQPLRVMRNGSTGEEGYELWAPPEALEPLRSALLEKGRAQGLVPCGSRALETLRIEAGIPKYGSELAEDTLPLEAGLDGELLKAVSFTKGCYIGQEIVERARSRGRVNWRLLGLFVETPEAPAPGEKVLKEGNPVGEITSACVSPALGRTLAMAYLRREVADPGTSLALASGAGAEVTTLPFYRSPAL
ncbi:MAG: aminomethyltransferase family protein [Terriglobia bacterium]